jgi:hypothetical protein
MGAVVMMLMDPAISLQRACDLDDLQKHLLRLFSERPAAKPFSHAARKQLAKSLGLETLKVITVQYALRRLAEKTIVSKSARGLYVFESDAFERWVKGNAALPATKKPLIRNRHRGDEK